MTLEELKGTSVQTIHSEVISSTNLVSSLRFGGVSPASRTLISVATKTYYSLLSAILDSLYQNFHKVKPR